MNFDNISQYLDYVIIALLVMGLLAGFFKGLFKSTYNFIVFVGLVLVGWLLMPTLINFAYDYNLSSFNININGVAITTIRDSIPNIAASYDATIGSMMTEGSETYALVFAFASSILRLALMIVWLVLVFTVFKFIFWIIYLIIKPRSKDKEGNKKKIHFVSRLGGGFVGVLQTTILVLLLAIPFAGICSIGNEIASVAKSDAEPVAYYIVKDDEIYVLSLANESSSIYEDNKEIFDFMANYRKTFFGTLGGTLKVDKKSLDEYLFDKVFSFKTEDEEFAFRTEIASAAKAYMAFYDATGGVISNESIASLDEQTLDKIFKEVKNIRLINVIVPVAVEYVFNNQELNEKYSNILGSLDKDDIIKRVKEIDFSNDLANVGSAFVDLSRSGILNLLNKESGVTFLDYIFTANPDDIDKAMAKLNGMDLLDFIGEVGINSLMSSKFIDELCNKYDIDKSAINLNQINWSVEVSTLGGLISALQKSGITLTSEKKLDMSKVTEEGINDFIDKLYELNVLNKNTSLLAGIVKTVLPEEYKDLVPVGDISSDDMKSIFVVGTTVLNYQDEDGNIDFMAVIASNDREKIGNALNSSEKLSHSFEGLIIPMLASFGMEAKLEDLDLTNLDWVNELDALNNIVNEFEKSGLKFGSTTTQFDFTSLTDEEIDSLSKVLFSSKIVENNSQILMSAVRNMLPSDYQKMIEIKKVNENDFKSILKLGVTLSDSETGSINVDKLLENGVDELAEQIANSDYLSDSMGSIVSTIIGENTSLATGEEIKMVEEVDWQTEEGKKELEAMLEASKVLADKTTITDFLNLTEEEKAKVYASKVVSSVIISTITSDAAKEESDLLALLDTTGVSDEEWLSTETKKGELEKLLDAAEILSNTGDNALDIDTIASLTDEDIKTLTASKIVVNALDQNVSNIVQNTIEEKIGTNYNIDLPIGNVEGGSEAWTEELTILKDVTNNAQDIDVINIDSEADARKVGSLLDSAKDSQILGDAAIEIATAILTEAYEGLEGQTAPEVNENTDFSAEILKAFNLVNNN